MSPGLSGSLGLSLGNALCRCPLRCPFTLALPFRNSFAKLHCLHRRTLPHKGGQHGSHRYGTLKPLGGQAETEIHNPNCC